MKPRAVRPKHTQQFKLDNTAHARLLVQTIDPQNIEATKIIDFFLATT